MCSACAADARSSDADQGSSAAASTPAASPAQPSSSTQWAGPDLTQDTTTVMVCLADGTRQVHPIPSPHVHLQILWWSGQALAGPIRHLSYAMQCRKKGLTHAWWE